MLQSIDDELIRLLGQRIRLQKESIEGGISADTARLLAQNGVPEFVWENLLINCAAARSVVASANESLVRPRRVTIIGGRGRMGRFFAQTLTKAGHEVSILKHDGWDEAAQLLGQAELVLVCVPLEQTLTVIKQAAQFVTPSTTLVDITSVKSNLVQAILEVHVGPVLSLHPLFGPGVQSFLSQNAIVCPGRKQEAYQWFLEFIQSQGGKLIFCTPQEHDQIMITVQTIRHFAIFSLGVFLAEAQIDLARCLDCSTPLYRLLHGIVSRMFAQDASLSLKMMFTHPERRHAIRHLSATFNRLAQMVEQSDRVALEQEFETARSFFQLEAERSFEETNYVINSLSVLIAALETETQPVEQSLSLVS